MFEDIIGEKTVTVGNVHKFYCDMCSLVLQSDEDEYAVKCPRCERMIIQLPDVVYPKMNAFNTTYSC